MRRILLLGCMCLGGMIVAGIGCGDDSSSNSKKKTPDTGDNGSGGNGTAPGPELKYVDVCKAAAKAGLRERICKESGGLDVNDDADKAQVDWDGYGDSYESALEWVLETCEKNDPSLLGIACANPNPKALQDYYDAVAKAAGCGEIASLENSEKFKAICSSPGPGPGGDVDWIEACKADVEVGVRYWLCGKTEEEKKALIAEYAAEDCKDEETAKEQFSSCTDYEGTVMVAEIKECASTLRTAKDCDEAEDIYDECSNSCSY